MITFASWFRRKLNYFVITIAFIVMKDFVLPASDTPSTESSSTFYMGTKMVASYTSVYMNSDIKIHKATIAAQGDSFEKALLNSGFVEEAIDLLLKAVDNRTKERDYFRLYCDLLDKSITDEQFDTIINTQTDEYVVKEDIEPDLRRLQVALELSKRIRNTNSVEDLASLFSFDSSKIKSLVNNG